MAKKDKTSKKASPLGAFGRKSFGPGFNRGEGFAFDRFLEYCEKEANPVFFLCVWLLCDKHNIPIPDSVRQYLRESFKRVIQLEKTERTAAEDFYAAFKMTCKPGARKPFTLFRLHQKRLFVGGLVAGRIYEKRQRCEKVSEEAVMREVANEVGMSFPSVRDAFYGKKFSPRRN